MRVEPFTLTGTHVELVPLEADQRDELVEAASGDRTTYAYTEVPSTPEWMADYIARLHAAAEADEVVPFAQRRLVDGRLVGCTRYLELRWWRRRDVPDEVEIGGTWLAADAQRSPINTEAKLLLMTHAFETWGVMRVALCTDVRNERSRRAIERVGASFEGVLRHHRLSYVTGEQGGPRDSAMFAVTDDEWPDVKVRLQERLRTSQ